MPPGKPLEGGTKVIMVIVLKTAGINRTMALFTSLKFCIKVNHLYQIYLTCFLEVW